jgi:hypothetical protein
MSLLDRANPSNTSLRSREHDLKRNKHRHQDLLDFSLGAYLRPTHTAIPVQSRSRFQICPVHVSLSSASPLIPFPLPHFSGEQPSPYGQTLSGPCPPARGTYQIELPVACTGPFPRVRGDYPVLWIDPDLQICVGTGLIGVWRERAWGRVYCLACDGLQ